jgi:hypothetical protein
MNGPPLIAGEEVPTTLVPFAFSMIRPFSGEVLVSNDREIHRQKQSVARVYI